MANVTALDLASKRLSEAFSLLESRISAQQPDQAMAAEVEKMQAELSAKWQEHYDQQQADQTALQAERDELMRDNEALRNDLHALKQDFLELQHFNEKIAARMDEQVSQLELIAG
tara:strand:- start:5060 stop:5404 length:345 start_codon:yes stop_codon:yes gene_type:complete